MVRSRPGSVGDYSDSASIFSVSTFSVSTFSGNDNLLYATGYVHYAVWSALAQAKITRSGRRDDHVAFRVLIALREQDGMPSAMIAGNGLRSCFQTSGAWFFGDEAPHTPERIEMNAIAMKAMRCSFKHSKIMFNSR